MATPIGKARELLAQIETAAVAARITLPKTRYAQLGEPVVTCAALIVTLARLDPAGPEYNVQSGCLTSQIGTFTLTIARDCAVTYDEEGIDDPALVDEVSQIMSDDGDFLWNFAAGLSLYLQKDWAMSWSLPGGLAISTLSLTAGVD